MCVHRIRGAILDELREMDWVPRLVRSRSHKLNLVTKQLEMELGRVPSKDEVSRKLGLPVAEYDKLMKDSSAITQVSLSRKWFETDGDKDVREIDTIEDKHAELSINIAEHNDLREYLMRGLDRMSRLIIFLYYYEEYNMGEISELLGISQSRISQLHDSIILQLKSRQKLEELFTP